MNKKQLLTRGEEEVMQILWQLGEAVVGDIIEQMPAPQPKYTTVATFLKILENKGFVAHKSEGRINCYYPLIDKEEHAQSVVSGMLTNYFGGSLSRMVSFFAQREQISVREMDEILEIMRNKK